MSKKKFKDNNVKPEQLKTWLEQSEEMYRNYVERDIKHDFDKIDAGMAEKDIRDELNRLLTTSEVLYTKYLKKCKKRLRKPISYEQYGGIYVSNYRDYEDVPDSERKSVLLTSDTFEECVKMLVEVRKRLAAIPKDKREGYIKDASAREIQKRAMNFGLMKGIGYEGSYEMQTEVEKAQAKTLREKLRNFFKIDILQHSSLKDFVFVLGGASVTMVGSLGLLITLFNIIDGVGLSAMLADGLYALALGSVGFLALTPGFITIVSIIKAIKNKLNKTGNIEEYKKYIAVLKEMAEKDKSLEPALAEAENNLQLLGGSVKERSL